jgi:hypothetical protein
MFWPEPSHVGRYLTAAEIESLAVKDATANDEETTPARAAVTAVDKDTDASVDADPAE